MSLTLNPGLLPGKNLLLEFHVQGIALRVFIIEIKGMNCNMGIV